jgi:eukaryotic-like serine/threonine-protein kinase
MLQATAGENRGNAVSAAPGIDVSALSAGTDGHPTPSGASEVNESIGPYRLLELIGSGGMGEVWLAEQTTPVHRRVAIKLIKAGMDTREVVARFQSERQALALMDHPGIAKVFDAGSTAQGRPYFVMAYISGVPITEYCDRHRMTLRERLELFVQVCDGVQHAHQKAIIHRDLKPSNILVSEVDGKPLPRIIDFGVAKAIAHGLIGDAECTRTGVILGTPTYMSPEQAGSIGIDVDTRSDVYSLGVVLYELLVGARPLEFHNLAFDEMLRRLREQESPRPSTKLRTAGDSNTTAENRGADPPTLIRQLRGELDAITLKALEKDRARRYASAAELAGDIGRYLRDEPVQAVPPSVAYRARKFAWRYRAGLAIATAFILLLVLAAFFIVRQSIRAKSEAATAQAISDFLQHDLLSQASSFSQWSMNAKADPDLKVRTVLDRAAARISGRFTNQPEIEAAIRDTMGQTYLDVGMNREARAQWQRAMDLYRQTLGPENPKTLKATMHFAGTLATEGRFAEAHVAFSRTLNIQRRVLGPRHPDTLGSMFSLADLYREQGNYPQAEAQYLEVIPLSRGVLGAENPLTLQMMDRLADLYYREGKLVSAEALDQQVLEIRRRVLGPDHPDTTISIAELANVYGARGEYAKEELLCRQVLDMRRRIMGPEHAYSLAAMNNLAQTYLAEGKYAQAEALDKQTLEIRRRVLGPESVETLMSMVNLADDYSDEKKYSLAEPLFGQTIEIHRRASALKSRHALATLSDAAFMYQREGKYAIAENYEAQALAGWQQAAGSNSAIAMDAAADLATTYVSEGKFAAAEPLARQAVEFDRRNRPDDWQRFRAETLLGASLAGQKKFPEAEPLLLEGYRGMLAQKERIAAPNWYHLDLASAWAVQLYRAWRKPEKAAAWERESRSVALPRTAGKREG